MFCCDTEHVVFFPAPGIQVPPPRQPASSEQEAPGLVPPRHVFPAICVAPAHLSGLVSLQVKSLTAPRVAKLPWSLMVTQTTRLALPSPSVS